MLSTMEPIEGPTKDDYKQKLAMFKLHYFTKEGANFVDQ